VLKRTLASGDIDCPVSVADEIAIIRSDGDVTTQTNALSESSCSDMATIDGCLATLERRCSGDGCTVDALSVLDGETWTGIQSISVSCSDSFVACSYDMRLESR
jgi:hypothetical protein